MLCCVISFRITIFGIGPAGIRLSRESALSLRYDPVRQFMLEATAFRGVKQQFVQILIPGKFESSRPGSPITVASSPLKPDPPIASFASRHAHSMLSILRPSCRQEPCFAATTLRFRCESMSRICNPEPHDLLHLTDW